MEPHGALQAPALEHGREEEEAWALEPHALEEEPQERGLVPVEQPEPVPVVELQQQASMRAAGHPSRAYLALLALPCAH